METVRSQVFDGDGRVMKSTTTQNINGGMPGTTITEYFIRSSVTGNKILELDGEGDTVNAYVYAGKQVIAQQFAVGTTPWVAWQHENPITGDALNTMSDGVEAARTTPDALGINTGDEDPFFDPAGGEEGPFSESQINQIVGSIIPWFGGPTCYVNRAVTGCRFATSLLATGAAEPWRPSGTFLRFLNRETGEVRRVAAYYGALPGGGGFGYVPVSQPGVQPGIVFDGNYVSVAWADGAVGSGTLTPSITEDITWASVAAVVRNCRIGAAADLGSTPLATTHGLITTDSTTIRTTTEFLTILITTRNRVNLRP